MFRTLNAQKLIDTTAALQRRIAERFPDSGLSKVAGELVQITREASHRSERIRRPNMPLRVAVGVLVAGILALVAYFLSGLRFKLHSEAHEFLQELEAALASVVFIGAAIIFLLSMETRLKRQRAFKALYELRVLAHIVDMHQLTKDPERVMRSGPATASSPSKLMTAFELCRYLDYCSELLALISKMSVLYAQGLRDPASLEAVDQVEVLTTGLSRKIWQKIMIVEQMGSAPLSRKNPD
jgi:hypothetical protein